MGPLLAWAPPVNPPVDPADPAPADQAPVDEGPTAAQGFSGQPIEMPFAAEELQLSEVLEIALDENVDFQNRLIAVEISEANIMAALGAFDVQLTAGVAVNLSKTTPRGSAFVFSRGSRSLTGYLGVSRRLETGGNISLRLDVSRTLTDQPTNPFNPTQGGIATLAQYQIRPTLTFSHPLLKGMGIKVNRAQINQAKLARSTAEAVELTQAQTMVRDIVSAYWDVLFAKRDLANKHQSVELAQQQLDRTNAQVRAGRLAAVEAKAVEQSLAQRETDVILAENRLLESSLTLRTLMGQEFADRDVLGVVPSTDPAAFEVETVDTQAAIDRALANNPQVRQLEIALASKRIDEVVQANNRLPQLDFTGSFAPSGRSVDSSPSASTGDPGSRGSWGEAFRNFITDDIASKGLFAEYTVSGALDLTWSIQNRTAKGNHQRVLAEIRQAELNLKQIRQTTSTSVIRATNNLRSAAKRYELANVSVELAEQNLAAEQARFEVGRSTNYDVLFRIDALTAAQATALQAQIDYLKAKVDLQSLTGEILPAYGLDLPGDDR
ncbi:TolC family protein [Nannocystaceae bacterium ST9]